MKVELPDKGRDLPLPRISDAKTTVNSSIHHLTFSCTRGGSLAVPSSKLSSYLLHLFFADAVFFFLAGLYCFCFTCHTATSLIFVQHLGFYPGQSEIDSRWCVIFCWCFCVLFSHNKIILIPSVCRYLVTGRCNVTDLASDNVKQYFNILV